MKSVLRLLACVLVLWDIPAYAATLSVPAGGDLQAALNAAQPGDVIALEPGARFVGQFTFPFKAGVVTLTTAGVLPARRIQPSDAPLLATLVSPYGAMAVNLYDSANWTLKGLRFERNAGGVSEVIGIWRGANITLDRLLLDVPDGQDQQRFVLGNGTNITLTQSYCAGVWSAIGKDSQCFVAWDGAGPYTLTDNFLEAASENVMFGGADSSSPENIPSDIRIEGNTFTKRLSWQGNARGVKNLFELKSARRVLVRNNLFERCWIDAQAGRAIVFTPRNQDGSAPWSIVSDVVFERNTVRDVSSGVNIIGYDSGSVDAPPPESQQTSRIVVRNNVIATTSGQALLLMDEIGTVEISGNTITVPEGAAMMTLAAGEGVIHPAGETIRPSAYAVRDLTFANNTYTGYIHSALALGDAALELYTETLTRDLPTEPAPTPDPIVDPVPPPLTPVQRIDQAIAVLSPLEQTLTGKPLTNLRNILTRLRTLRGQVQ